MSLASTGMMAIAAIVVIVAIAGAAVAFNYSPPNTDPTRMHGDISTALGSPELGSADAPITIVEFGDYQCHQCYNWFHNTKPAIMRDYIDTGKAKLVFVDLAFLGADSPIAAQASYCAGDQGMYWEYHDVLYNEQQPQIDSGWASKDNLVRFAEDLNLDMELFESCLDSNKYRDRVNANIREAKNNGVAATPGFFIISGDQQEKISGAQPYIVFKHILDDMI